MAIEQDYKELLKNNKRKREKDVEFYKYKKKEEFDYYNNVDIEKYKRDLPKALELWNMDQLNAMLGVTKKLWWEEYFKNKFTNKKILDIGCGNGYHVPYWSLCGNKVTGLDSSQESLNILSNILKKLDLKARLVKGFIEDSVINDKFDVVNFSNMLHHVEDVPKSLSNAKKMLKKDGYLIVVEPIYNFPFRWIVETNFLKRINLFRKYFIKKKLSYEEEKALSNKEYIKYIKNAGFKIVHLKYDRNFFGYALTLLGIKNKKIKKFVFNFDKTFTKFVPKPFRSFIYIVAKPTS